MSVNDFSEMLSMKNESDSECGDPAPLSLEMGCPLD